MLRREEILRRRRTDREKRRNEIRKQLKRIPEFQRPKRSIGIPLTGRFWSGVPWKDHKFEIPSGSSVIIEHLHSHPFYSGKKNRKLFPHKSPKKYTIRIPESFSLIQNHVETLDKLEELRTIVCNPKIKEIYFDHSACKDLELGASIIMDSMVLAAKNVRTINCLGHAPFDPHAREIFYLTGLYKHLGLSEDQAYGPQRKQYRRFELIHGRKDKIYAKRSTQAEYVQSDLTLYFNKLLNEFGLELSEFGRMYVSQLIGEVIDNAEQHSELGEWYVIGYMEPQAEGKGLCHIVLMNYGITIDESLRTVILRQDIKKIVDHFIRSHRKFYCADYSQNQLWTILALQEGMSRLNLRTKDETRGIGTVNMIDFFDKLASHELFNKPQMVLISNDTLIRFDGSYHLADRKFGKDDRKIIAFNSTNSLSEKPDTNYVVKLPCSFPGTVLTMRFTLDENHLKRALI